MPEITFTTDATGLLGPAVALMIWTTVMWFWLYAERIPALTRLKVKLDPRLPKEQLLAKLPPEARWKSDNYNHLLEQPVLFYAVIFTLFVLGEGNSLNLFLAWGYVILRVVHSLVQSLWNKIIVRFWVFTAASMLLFILIGRAAFSLWF
tara:strand:- start:370 stop:816 length:447 start_codon:yes stop_codon:yes gene_type:complete